MNFVREHLQKVRERLHNLREHLHNLRVTFVTFVLNMLTKIKISGTQYMFSCLILEIPLINQSRDWITEKQQNA